VCLELPPVRPGLGGVVSDAVDPPCGRALVADDDPLVQWAVRQTIESLGYRVETASTRDEMLGRLFGGGIDLVVTANALERIDVMDIVRELRLYRHETAVCVLCSRENADEYRKELPGSVLLEKPFALEDLTQSVRQATAPDRSRS
jgi:DNA-binding NtrC family response regulator